MSRFRRASLAADPGYTPGEQPSAEGWLKLNTNEAPLPPSARVAAAVQEASAGLRRYPDPDGEPLRSALAARHGVAAERVLVANGGDDVLACCFRAFVEPGDAVVHAAPSYSLLPVLARRAGARDVALQVRADGDLRAAFAGEPAALRIVVNPNSPTGAWIEPSSLRAALQDASGVIVVDEAYADFAPASCVPLLHDLPGWIVLRSFSKGYALAGLRVGYALAAAELIADLRAVQDSYPVDRLALAGAQAALADEAHHQAIVRTVLEQRTLLTGALRQRGWEVGESQANFILAKPPEPLEAAQVAAFLRSRRILVRHFGSAGLERHLRISVGDAADHERLLAALDRAAGGAR